MIRIHELRVDYEDVCAVDDLSLEIGAGEVFGLIGPNGAGKTSTMRALAGLLEPTYGEIEVLGVDVCDQPEQAMQHIAFMPDFPPMYEDLKVWEFLDLFAASYFVPRKDRKKLIDANLELVSLTEKRDAMVKGLSRGMRQRLMLAKTLLPEPKVLLLDEPASGMDPNGRLDFKRIMQEQAAKGHTVLLSSHILSEMSEFCTSVGIMERGRLIVAGTVDEVTSSVMGSEILTVEVLEGIETFQRIVDEAESAGTAVCKAGETAYELSFAGDAQEASELLRRLIAAGVRIASFSRKREGLEEVFQKIGAKELQ